jgi:hypothetical protein
LPFPSLICPVHAHRSVSCAARARRRRPEAPPHPRRSLSVPEFGLEVSNLPMPLFRQVSPQCPSNSSPELIRAAVSPLCRVLRPLVPPCRFCAHGRVPQIALSALELFPKPLEPCLGQSPRLRRDFATGSSGSTTPASGHQPLDLGRPSEIGRFRLNQSRPNLSPPIQIQLFSSLPLTRAPVAGPGLSAPPWFADTPSLLISLARAPVSARAPAGSNHVR